jgi:hypothetical protein
MHICTVQYTFHIIVCTMVFIVGECGVQLVLVLAVVPLLHVCCGESLPCIK